MFRTLNFVPVHLWKQIFGHKVCSDVVGAECNAIYFLGLCNHFQGHSTILMKLAEQLDIIFIVKFEELTDSVPVLLCEKIMTKISSVYNFTNQNLVTQKNGSRQTFFNYQTCSSPS